MAYSYWLGLSLVVLRPNDHIRAKSMAELSTYLILIPNYNIKVIKEMIPTQPEHTHNAEQCFDLNKKFQKPTHSTKLTANQEKHIVNFQHYIGVVNKFAHNYLYCRDPTQMLTVSQNKVLSNERHKYLSYITKTFKYKLPDEFTSKKIMKEKRMQLLKKMKEERLKKQEQQHLKAPKRRRQVKSKQIDEAPKKKAKLNEAQTQKKTKAAKKQGQKGKNKKDTDKKEKKKVQQDNNEMDNQNDEQAVNAIQDNFQSEEDLGNKDLDDFEEQDE